MNKPREAPIGVFDSGIGGLTVAREIMRQIPQERIVYFGDTARLPYGSKSRNTIIRYSRQIVRFLRTRQVKAIVVACNTASAYALDTLQQESDIPIIGVVKPGARMAAKASPGGNIGVIGTAMAQGIVAGIGFWIVGMPGTILLGFAVTALSVVPVGPPLVWIPCAAWLYTQGEIGYAVFLFLWGTLAVSSVDNFLKPILIARGTPLPLALVFLGVLGGLMTFGFLGLILGPVLLSIGMALLQAWLKRPLLAKRPLDAPPAEEELPAPEGENTLSNNQS